jgi:hypothetical protein
MAKKKNKAKINKKEIIITICVLLGAIILGFTAGKALFEALS